MKPIPLLLCVLAAATLLTGCGAKEPPEKSPSPVETTAATAVSTVSDASTTPDETMATTTYSNPGTDADAAADGGTTTVSSAVANGTVPTQAVTTTAPAVTVTTASTDVKPTVTRPATTPTREPEIHFSEFE